MKHICANKNIWKNVCFKYFYKKYLRTKIPVFLKLESNGTQSRSKFLFPLKVSIFVISVIIQTFKFTKIIASLNINIFQSKLNFSNKHWRQQFHIDNISPHKWTIIIYHDPLILNSNPLTKCPLEDRFIRSISKIPPNIQGVILDISRHASNPKKIANYRLFRSFTRFFYASR